MQNADGFAVEILITVAVWFYCIRRIYIALTREASEHGAPHPPSYVQSNARPLIVSVCVAASLVVAVEYARATGDWHAISLIPAAGFLIGFAVSPILTRKASRRRAPGASLIKRETPAHVAITAVGYRRTYALVYAAAVLSLAATCGYYYTRGEAPVVLAVAGGASLAVFSAIFFLALRGLRRRHSR